MKRTVYAAIFSLMMLPIDSIAQDFPLSKDYSGNYLCKMTAGAGIRYDEASQKWISATFNVENASYVVKVIDTSETDKTQLSNETARIYNITVKDFGSMGQALPCFNGKQTPGNVRRNITISTGFTSCVFIGNSYRFDFETLKMQNTYDGGYMDNDELNTDTPAVFVGKCQRLD
jgi:hypothetical protein